MWISVYLYVIGDCTGNEISVTLSYSVYRTEGNCEVFYVYNKIVL